MKRNMKVRSEEAGEEERDREENDEQGKEQMKSFSLLLIAIFSLSPKI
jgi:hypothetical protein